MTDKTITQLTAATTPLVGTEVLPIVQSSTTRKVSVADLTAGRSISASGASISGNVSVGTATAIARLTVDAASGSPSTTNKGALLVGTDTNVGVVIGAFDGTGSNYNGYIQTMDKRSGFDTAYGLTLQPLGGNVTLTNGNVIIGTAGKGIDFSVNTNAAGMTSELLNDYEEGTWSPTIIGSTVAGTATYDVRNASYTKIGRLVHVEAYMVYSAGTGSGDLYIGNLPYTVENTYFTYTPIVCRQSSIAVPANEQIYGRAEPGTSYIRMYSITDAGAQTSLAYDDNALIAFQATYTTS